MPNVSKIHLLPEEVRQELDRRIVAQAFGGIENLTTWLRDTGFTVGKSSVGVYAKRLQRSRQLSSWLGAPAGPEMALVRLRLECAAIAAASGAGDQLFERADEVLMWAMQPFESEL